MNYDRQTIQTIGEVMRKVESNKYLGPVRHNRGNLENDMMHGIM